VIFASLFVAFRLTVTASPEGENRRALHNILECPVQQLACPAHGNAGLGPELQCAAARRRLDLTPIDNSGRKQIKPQCPELVP
jgi:hypothetical protein